METAIRWSPSSTLSCPRFLFVDVLNRSFNFGTLTSYHTRSNPKITYDYSATYRSVPPFRALDWAPSDEGLVAVGTPSGETAIMRIDDTEAPRTTFPARYQRPCNAVAISQEGKLATGLERVRSDSCLNVWDVEAQAGKDAGGESHGSGGRSAYVEPMRKFAVNEAVSSIKFFASQPDVLVVGIKGVGIRCYDTREGSTNPSLQFTTPCVHNIAIDPLNEVHFACAGPVGDTTIQIWDVRYDIRHAPSVKSSGFNFTKEDVRDAGPILSYSDVFNIWRTKDGREAPATIWSLKYCRSKAGLLGALASTGEFRGFETQRTYATPIETSGEQRAMNAEPQSQEVAPLYSTRKIHYFRNAVHSKKRAEDQAARIVSFDFTNLSGAEGQPTAIVLQANRSITLLEVSDKAPCADLSSSGVLAISKSEVILSASLGSEEQEEADTLHQGPEIEFHASRSRDASLNIKKDRWVDILTKSSKLDINGDHAENGVDVSSFERHKLAFGLSREPRKISAEEALTLGDTTRDRCASGYGLDCKKNKDVTSENPWLQQLWEWIERAQTHATDESLSIGSPDLSYAGIYNFWAMDSGSEHGSRGTNRPQPYITEAVKRRIKKLKVPNAVSCQTRYIDYRLLSLRTLGFSLSEQELADIVIRYARDGQQTRGAALAMMLGHHRLASTALKTGRLEPHHQALAIAVAAYVKGTTDDSWNDVVQSVLQDVTDPYARAILALVKRSNWRDVLQEVSLPLRERVGIALLHLPDAELTPFIRQNTAGVIERGDIEGIILTGLTENAVPLFKVYGNTFSDLQTAILALSHTSPRFFRSKQVESWRQTYRSWMNTWGLYLERAKFDVALTKLAISPEGKSLLESPPRQLIIHCSYCDGVLDGNAQEAETRHREESTASSFGSYQDSIFGNGRAGSGCPTCGRPMPRCVICLHWLGGPSQESRYGTRTAGKMTRKQRFDQMTAFCRRCEHMYHVGHAETWFSKHSVCPQVGCECHCREGENEVNGSSPER